MSVLVGPLTQTGSRTNGTRLDVYFLVPVSVKQKSIKAEVHIFSCDGSIAEHAGKFYASLTGTIELVASTTDPKLSPVRCPKCSAELAPALAPLLFERLEALGYPIAPWRSPGGWWIFEVAAPTLSDIEFTGRNRYGGTELMFAEYKQVLRCPFHGQITRYDEEPID